MTADRAAEMRHAFDQSFAAAPATGTDVLQDFVAIQLGGHPHAVRIAELAGLFADRRVTRVPGRRSELLGIASVRGALVPVFDLAASLGYPATAASRWLMIATARSFAFAIESFEGHVRVPASAIAPSADHSAHVREVMRGDWGVRAIIELSSVIETLIERAHAR